MIQYHFFLQHLLNACVYNTFAALQGRESLGRRKHGALHENDRQSIERVVAPERSYSFRKESRSYQKATIQRQGEESANFTVMQ